MNSFKRAEIAIVTVANDGPFVNSVVDNILNFIEELQLALTRTPHGGFYSLKRVLEILEESVEIIRL